MFEGRLQLRSGTGGCRPQLRCGRSCAQLRVGGEAGLLCAAGRSPGQSAGERERGRKSERGGAFLIRPTN